MIAPSSVSLLALAATVLPQEPPPPVDAVQAALRTHKLTPRLDAILKRSGAPKVKYRKIKPPRLLTSMRKAGAKAYDLDLRRQLSGAYEATPRSDFWFEFVDSQLLGKPAKIKEPKIGTVKDIKKFFDYIERDMRRALDIGKPLERTVPRLHSLMERMQRDRNGYVVTADDHEMIDKEVRHAIKVDVAAMWTAAKKVILLARVLNEPKLLKKLRASPKARIMDVGHVTGDVLLDVVTPFGGRIVVGGAGRNEYDCTQIEIIVDLGGDDLYRGPAGGAGGLRRFAVCLDFEGDDTYECLNDALGSATYGIGVLIDVAGNDKYTATDRSAGFGAAGVGVFVDVAGDDEMKLGAHSGGVGLVGVGICVDLAGTDIQEASDVSFGCGLPAGFGLFLDAKGDDKRSLFRDKSHAYLGMGAGRGLRGALAGGVGVCLDLAGNDNYTGGDLCFGAGEDGGAGIFVDALGDDVYVAHDLSVGAARQGSIAVFQDWAGSDNYRTAAMGLGFAVLNSRAFCFDLGGNDTYQVRGTGLGVVGGEAMAFFWDSKGKDSYLWDRGGKEPVDSRLGLGMFLDTGGAKNTYKRAGTAFFEGAEGDGKTLFRGDKSDVKGTLHVFIDGK